MGTFVIAAGVYYSIFVMMGAPLFTWVWGRAVLHHHHDSLIPPWLNTIWYFAVHRDIEATSKLASVLATSTIVPAVVVNQFDVLGFQRLRLMMLLSSDHDVDIIASEAAACSVIGAVLGGVTLPLDWGVWWQVCSSKLHQQRIHGAVTWLCSLLLDYARERTSIISYSRDIPQNWGTHPAKVVLHPHHVVQPECTLPPTTEVVTTKFCCLWSRGRLVSIQSQPHWPQLSLHLLYFIALCCNCLYIIGICRNCRTSHWFPVLIPFHVRHCWLNGMMPQTTMFHSARTGMAAPLCVRRTGGVWRGHRHLLRAVLVEVVPPLCKGSGASSVARNNYE